MTRIVALDLARFLAVIGMMAAHLSTGTTPDWVLEVVTGFPSSAFAVFGGVSAILATRRLSAEGRHLAAALSLAARGVVVAILGLVLQLVGWPILVVLTYFGAGLVCLALLLRLPTRALLAVAVLLALGGPALNLVVRSALGDPNPEVISTDSPTAFVASLAFTGTYPVVTWLVYLTLGAAIGRMLVASRAPSLRPGLLLVPLGAAGLLAAVLADALSGPQSAPGTAGGGAPVGTGIRMLLDTTPHTGSLGDIVRTASAACLVLGLLLLATRAGDRLPLVLRPVRAAGAAPLTIYTLHVVYVGTSVALALALGNPSTYQDDPDWWLGGLGIWALNVAVAIGIGGLLAALRRRGPLESVVGAIASAAARLSPPRPRGATA